MLERKTSVILDRITLGIVFKLFFFTVVFHPVKGLTSTHCRGSQSKRDSLCRYGWKITVSPRFEQVKTVVIVETTTKEAVAQGIGASEEAA